MKVNILAFAAHPDDIEISCAGTICKQISLGHKVAIVDLTRGELGTRGTSETRATESNASSKIMGIHYRENLKFRDGFFVHDEPHLMEIIKMIRKYQPQIVLCNSPSDRHPDHGRAGKLVAEACFLSGLPKIKTYYEDSEQMASRPKAVYHYIQDYFLKPDFVVDVSGFEKQKIKAIKAFKTQFFDPESNEPNTPISREDFFDFILGRMKEMGRPIGVDYAEGFISNRYIGIHQLNDLI
ncbi:MAG: bacillithiol biosynthesis deacetylase BshB1 [Chitinophagales bacterium]|nr:bacillithiol biosynthesis deacetylase BshB1 [Chitinophagales bacterium]MCZ2392757.1 bacillithiol biosynthesis deacetylase BshB1 [Chitinophagales bacterium]